MAGYAQCRDCDGLVAGAFSRQIRGFDAQVEVLMGELHMQPRTRVGGGEFARSIMGALHEEDGKNNSMSAADREWYGHFSRAIWRPGCDVDEVIDRWCYSLSAGNVTLTKRWIVPFLAFGVSGDASTSCSHASSTPFLH